jgi:hypothetical protein
MEVLRLHDCLTCTTARQKKSEVVRSFFSTPNGQKLQQDVRLFKNIYNKWLEMGKRYENNKPWLARLMADKERF